jgi:MEMO1 family protein
VPIETLGIVAPHPPIMVPEVGGSRAEVTSASADALAVAADLLRRFDPETIVVMSPHAQGLYDAFVVDSSDRYAGDLGDFGAPSVALHPEGDPGLALAILRAAGETGLPAMDRVGDRRLGPGRLDHGVLVPMSFLDREGRWPIVVLPLTFLPYDQHRRFGEAIASAARSLGRRVAFLASGDSAHRLTPDAPAGFSPRAREFDETVVRLLQAGEYRTLETIDEALVEDAGQCGLRSWITLGGFLEGTGAVTRVLAYEGPWGVGYPTAVAVDADVAATLPPPVIEPTPASGRKGGLPGEEESAPVALARRTIDAYVRYGVELEPDRSDDPLLATRAGAFVSLHRGEDLRGCIGTIGPTMPTLAEEIVHNAVQAATCDPRFPAMAPEELDDLDISVDVLHEAERVAGLDELDVKRYGVIVTAGYRRGLLLPDLEGVDTPEEQVSIAMRKAGIRPGEPVSLERFRVDRYH